MKIFCPLPSCRPLFKLLFRNIFISGSSFRRKKENRNGNEIEKKSNDFASADCAHYAFEQSG